MKMGKTQNGTSEGNGDQIKRELQRGSRICFRFSTCLSGGKYTGPSMRRADAGQDLSRIRWDDKTNYLVKLSQDNRFAGDDSSKMKPGEWMITIDENANDIGLSCLIAMCGNSEAQVDEIVFARNHSGVALRSCDGRQGSVIRVRTVYLRPSHSARRLARVGSRG